MSSVIKVNACVYSRLGYERAQNTNSFYLNGKFISEEHIDNLQASMENRGTEYLFTVADNMICSDEDNDANISILKEVGRYHEKITVNGGELKSKIKELKSRVEDSERLISGFLDMNRISVEDSRRGLGFGGILLSDGQFVAASMGTCAIFMMRDGMFRPLAGETSKAKRLLDAMTSSLEKDDEGDVTLPEEDPEGSVVVSDIYDMAEGDSFLIVSRGVLEALGEEKVEDLLSLRSDSSYIAFRMIDEAMKRNFSGDLTAMVIQVEKIYEGASPVRKPVNRQENMKTRVDRLNKAPSVTYKYNRRKTNRYQGALFLVLVVLTVGVLFGIIYIIINSMINTGKEKLPENSPTVTATVTPTATPDDDEPTVEPTEEPVEEPTPTPTPEPNAGEIKTHVVEKGQTINTISRLYYGTDALSSALCKYNGITDPNKIQIGQKIKVPPKSALE